MARVTIVKTRTGYTVYSFDFTENIYAVFTGAGSLNLALQFCNDKGYTVTNIHYYRRSKKEGGLLKESEKEK